MKTVVFFVLINFAFINCTFENIFEKIAVRTSPDRHLKAARGVVTRLLGSTNGKLFEMHINKNVTNGKDGFYIFKNNSDEKVSIVAPNGVSLVWGFHYYLKNYCNCHVSWDGDQLKLPDTLPVINNLIISFDRVRYYQNVCASSYSFVWWDWKRWEREIDWMALNGINMALAFTAQEAIWQRVYDALGIKKNDFTGPAFLAWNRMGNLRNFSYGLSSDWHRDQLNLQHKILNRMRDLGITPVLPAFCGIVPKYFKEAFPLASLTNMSKWSKFSEEYCCPFFLSPNDSLFPIVSRLFFREYMNEFGTNHIYNCDTFNENRPESGKLKYLSNISKSIYSEINFSDPGAIWMIQGWMFMDPFWTDKKRVKAFITGPPLGKMLILDLQSDLTPQYERLDSYFGQPFIWCMLHNFGGQLGMYGHLSRVNEEILKGRSFKNSTMIGIGITPEGIDQNYIMYDFALESSLRSVPENLTDWVTKYAIRRYGIFNKDLINAWLILKDTAYNFRPEYLYRYGMTSFQSGKLLTGEHISKNILTRLPSFQMHEPSWYNRSKIYDIFKKFLVASDYETVKSSRLFQHDLIDISRQTIQFAVSHFYVNLIKSYASSDIRLFNETSNNLLSILYELDIILGTGEKFLLGQWLESAKKCGKNKHEISHYEFNARNQITLWGPKGEIRDYAAKQWSGLVADYYKPRWKVFIDALRDSLLYDVPCNATLIKETIFFTVEKPFSNATKTYPTAPQGDTITIIRKFFYNWAKTLDEIFTNFTSTHYQVKLL